MRNWLLTFLFCCGIYAVVAQETMSISSVQGVALDSVQKQPLAGVGVRWLDSRGHVVASGITDSTGRFHLKAQAKAGENKLEIGAQGYGQLWVGFSVEGGNTDVGRLLLSPRYRDLDQVTITAERSSVTLAPDKKVYNVASDLAARGGTVAEVFRQVISLFPLIAGRIPCG